MDLNQYIKSISTAANTILEGMAVTFSHLLTCKEHQLSLTSPPATLRVHMKDSKRRHGQPMSAEAGSCWVRQRR